MEGGLKIISPLTSSSPFEQNIFACADNWRYLAKLSAKSANLQLVNKNISFSKLLLNDSACYFFLAPPPKLFNFSVSLEQIDLK